MTAAVIVFWAGCLWSITGALFRLIWTASFWRRLLVLAVLALTVSCAHRPKGSCDKSDKESSCNPGSVVVK